MGIVRASAKVGRNGEAKTLGPLCLETCLRRLGPPFVSEHYKVRVIKHARKFSKYSWPKIHESVGSFETKLTM